MFSVLILKIIKWISYYSKYHLKIFSLVSKHKILYYLKDIFKNISNGRGIVVLLLGYPSLNVIYFIRLYGHLYEEYLTNLHQ